MKRNGAKVSSDRKVYRSAAWFGRRDKDGFIHRSWMKNQGLPDDVFDGRPVIGICNTWSELTPCNAHLRDLAERVKRGVWEAGGLPLEFPVMSTGETNMRPTAMRSEEHTSELQSPCNLVCRLLLEKKNNKQTGHQQSHQPEKRTEC